MRVIISQELISVFLITNQSKVLKFWPHFQVQDDNFFKSRMLHQKLNQRIKMKITQAI